MAFIQKTIYKLLCGINYLHSCGIIHRDIKPSNILLSMGEAVKICDYSISKPTEVFITDYNYNDDFTSFSCNLTPHVTTRSYRAPEIILMQDYNYAIDLWSLGCVFGEMLMQYQTGEYMGPLINAHCCYPLSPATIGLNSEIKLTHKYDSLKAILALKGPLTEEDLSFIDAHDENVYKYITEMNELVDEHTQASAIFHKCPTDAISLFNELTAFNPRKRLPAKELLTHPFFQSVRNPLYEVESSTKIECPFISDLVPVKSIIQLILKELNSK
jgi:mitogen-activated protein kinase 1/3